jgi:hypothetical protein
MTTSFSPNLAAILAAADAAIANDNDPNTPWTPAWVAARQTRDIAYRRVPNDDDCCAGIQCYHYVSAPTKKVRGKDVDAPSGRVVADHDTILGRRRFAV